MEQYEFKVPSKGLCVMCLTELGRPSKGRSGDVSFKNVISYLEINYLKILNISSKNVLNDPASGNHVDIKVMLCRSCEDLRNKFCDLFNEMMGIQRKVDSCVQSMLEVMINAESNVIRRRHYRQLIAGESVNLPDSSSLTELIKASIPEKFRKETMIKCAGHIEKAKVKEKLLSPPVGKTKPITDEKEMEALGFDFVNEKDEDAASKVEDDLSDDEAMNVDDDADPEELMLRFNSFPDSYKHSMDEDSFDTTDGFVGTKVEGKGNVLDEADELELELENEAEQSGDSGEQEVDTSKTSFNSKFKCEICGKVVVSLKNFELHQRRHTGEKPFACPFCEQHFRDTSNLRSHTLRYHRQFLFANFKDASCTDEQFKRALDKIVQSIVIVSDGIGLSHQSHQCFLCNKEYTQKYAIEDHIVQRHYDVLSTAILHLQKDIKMQTSEEIAQYMLQVQDSGATCTDCGLCGLQFKSGLEVNAHMKVHVKVKVARSQGAVQKSNASDSLIQLKMKCNFCSKYFEDLHALTKHKTLHQGNCASAASREAVYKCEHCGRTFCSYYSQRSHVLSFHRYQVFSRYLPPNTTAAEIESVIKKITGKYKKLPSGHFQCSLCKKEITQLRKLQSHVLVTHFDEVVIKLKVAIHQIHYKNESGSGYAEIPQLEYYENGWNEGFDDSLNLGAYDGNGDVSENLEVVLSY